MQYAYPLARKNARLYLNAQTTATLTQTAGIDSEPKLLRRNQSDSLSAINKEEP